MKRWGWVLWAFSSVGSAHLLQVHVVSLQKALFRPSITAFGRVHGPDHVMLRAPYDALMGPLVYGPGTDVAAGAVIAHLLPLSLAASTRALTAKVAADKAAYEQARVLVRQGLMTPARGQQLRAAWGQAQATLMAASARLALGVVRAPFSGTLSYRVAPGAWLARGADVADVAGRADLYETAALTLREADRLAVGARVTMGGAAQGRAGHIYAIARSVDRLGLLPAYIRGLPGRLRPGQVVKLVLWGHKVQAYALPRAALVARQAKPAIFVVRDGRALRVPVVIIHLGIKRAFIANSLAPGTSVVVSGAARLRPGTPVQVIR